MSTIYNKCPFFPENATYVWLYNKKNVFLQSNKRAKGRTNKNIRQSPTKLSQKKVKLKQP